MFMDRKTQYSQEVSFPNSTRRFNEIPINLPASSWGISTKSKVSMEKQKTRDNQHKTEEQSQRTDTAWL